MSKIVSLAEAVAQIPDGSVVGIGGNVLHRTPMALVREVVRQNKKGLRLVKTAGAMDIDLLCLAGCAVGVDAGFVSYETKFGLAAHYRRAVQDGRVAANEHACYTVISALRAARAGVPFMPVRGLVESELIERNDYFSVTPDPFSGQPTTVVRAIAPDYALLHVHRACVMGNAVIVPPVFEDALLAQAAKHVILTAEEIVSGTRIRGEADRVNIPGVLVDAVVPLSGGAKPCSCWPLYELDEAGVKKFKALPDASGLRDWLEEYERMDHTERRML